MKRTRGPCSPGLARYQQQQMELAAEDAIRKAIRRDIARVRAQILAELAAERRQPAPLVRIVEL